MTSHAPARAPHAGVATASPAYRVAVLEPLFAAAKTHAAHYGSIDRAHAVMLVERGVIGVETGRALLGALARLDEDLALAGRSDAAEYEDLFFLREAGLGRLVGEDAAGRLHTGRSRNDIEATIFRLQLRARLEEALGRVCDLAATLLAGAERERGTLVLAYTHGQPAQPTTFGHYLAAAAEAFLRDAARVERALVDVDLCPLGAAAITSTGFAIDRRRVAELLGFADVQENTYGCIAAADQLAAAYGALRIVFLNIGRLAQDMAFWTAFEVGQARADDGFVQISSIMPQKRNPLAIEHIRTMASLGAGQCETVFQALHNTPFADMVDAEGPTQAAGLSAFAMLDRTAPLLSAFVAGIAIDEARVRANIDASCATMTELADSLVRREGLSFRQAHEVAAALSQILIRERRGISTLDGATVAEVFTRVCGRAPTLPPEDLIELVAPDYSIAVREQPGGPGPRALAESLAGYEARLAGVRTRQEERTRMRAQSRTKLADAVSAILRG